MFSAQEIKEIYQKIRSQVESRLFEFKKLFKEGSEEDIFSELVFCILTPQSKAQPCWECVGKLKKKNLLLKGTPKEISKEINKARFKNNKAKYIVGARKKFVEDGRLNIKSRVSQFGSARDAREWLVDNIKGMGYKEASHFLRNIGFGLSRPCAQGRDEDLAILDRHILKNLQELGVIKEVPLSLSRKKYLEIEWDMKEFAKHVNIPLQELDLVFWYKETGEIFK